MTGVRGQRAATALRASAGAGRRRGARWTTSGKAFRAGGGAARDRSPVRHRSTSTAPISKTLTFLREYERLRAARGPASSIGARGARHDAHGGRADQRQVPHRAADRRRRHGLGVRGAPRAARARAVALKFLHADHGQAPRPRRALPARGARLGHPQQPARHPRHGRRHGRKRLALPGDGAAVGRIAAGRC